MGCESIRKPFAAMLIVKLIYLSFPYLLLVIILCPSSFSLEPAPEMRTHFIDVGKASAVLPVFPSGPVLIDAAAQDNVHVKSLINYLSTFYKHRGDFNKTPESLFITYDHPDYIKVRGRYE